MKSSEICFVIQGPVFRSVNPGGDLTARAIQSIRHFFPASEIVLSSWLGQEIEGLDADSIILSQDPGPIYDFNGESINFNRQVVSTVAGLKKSSKPYSVKFRGDLLFCGSSFLNNDLLLTSKSDKSFFKKKIRMTNLFVQDPSKMPFLFHLSDIVQFGETSDMINFWDNNLFQPSEFLNYSMSRKSMGDFLGASIMRMRPEQALPISFLRKIGFTLNFENPNDFEFQKFVFAERFLMENFEVIDWDRSDIIFPARMMDSFLDTLHTQRSLRTIEADVKSVASRYAIALFKKKFLFAFSKAYLFHLKKEVVFRLPASERFFSKLKSLRQIIFDTQNSASGRGRRKLDSGVESIRMLDNKDSKS